MSYLGESFEGEMPCYEDMIDVTYKRFGLICGRKYSCDQDDQEYNTIKMLFQKAYDPKKSIYRDRTFEDYDHDKYDRQCASVLTWLRERGLLKKEDIKQYDLLRTLMEDSKKHLPAERLRMILEMDPESLIRTDEDDLLPLHRAAMDCRLNNGSWFTHLLHAGSHNFPMKKGVSL